MTRKTVSGAISELGIERGTGQTPWLREGESELIEFRLPELGEGIESGQVIEVFVTCPVTGSPLSSRCLRWKRTRPRLKSLPRPTEPIVDVCISAGDTVEINEVLVKINGDDEGRETPRRRLPRLQKRKQKRKNPFRRKNPSPKKSPKKKKNRRRRPEAPPQTMSPRRDLSELRRLLP